MSKGKTNAKASRKAAKAVRSGDRKPSGCGDAVRAQAVHDGKGNRRGSRPVVAPGAKASAGRGKGLVDAERKPARGKAAAGEPAPGSDAGGNDGEAQRPGRKGRKSRKGQAGAQGPVAGEANELIAKGTEAAHEDWLTPEGRIGLMVVRQLNEEAHKADLDHQRRGRPTKDTPQRREVILTRLARGDFLTVICFEERMTDPDFPIPRSVDRWAEGDPAFLAAIARARVEGAHHHLADGLRIVDTGFTDYIRTPFGVQFNAASVARSKLQAEYRQMLAEKLAPKQLGKKVEIAGDPDNPIGAQKPLTEYTEAALLEAFEVKKKQRANERKK